LKLLVVDVVDFNSIWMTNVFLQISAICLNMFDIHQVENAFRNELPYRMRLIEVIKADSMWEQVQVEKTTLVQPRTHMCDCEDHGPSELLRFGLNQRKHERCID
jgi:hypothetical protein